MMWGGEWEWGQVNDSGCVKAREGAEAGRRLRCWEGWSEQVTFELR